jgi:hypothetical protein
MVPLLELQRRQQMATLFVLERPVIIEVLYGCSGGGHRMRALFHHNMAIRASFISCSNLSLILLGNTVCVGHGSR